MDPRTDGRDIPSYRDARTHLKTRFATNGGCLSRPQPLVSISREESKGEESSRESMETEEEAGENGKVSPMVEKEEEVAASVFLVEGRVFVTLVVGKM